MNKFCKDCKHSFTPFFFDTDMMGCNYNLYTGNVNPVTGKEKNMRAYNYCSTLRQGSNSTDEGLTCGTEAIWFEQKNYPYYIEKFIDMISEVQKK